MEKTVVPVRKQMERFFPMENFRKKVIPSEVLPFSRFYQNDQNFLYHLFTFPGHAVRQRVQHDSSQDGGTGENCYYASPLMADFLVHNSEITGKKDGHFECLYFFYFIFFNTNQNHICVS